MTPQPRYRRPPDAEQAAVTKRVEGYGRTSYQDRGCEVAPACLRCPLAECKYDNERGYELYVRQHGTTRPLVLQLKHVPTPVR